MKGFRSVSLLMGLGSVLAVLPLAQAAQNDAGTGGDASNTFAAATPVTALGLYAGQLAGGTDTNDYYRFFVDAGEPINIEIRGVLSTGFFPADDNGLRMSFRLLSPQNTLLDTPNSNQGDSRVSLVAAPVAGEYRFLVTRDQGGFTGNYQFCFLTLGGPHPCPELGMEPIEIIFDGSINRALTRVLLVPPAHGDLGNPLGPTALDYLDAVLSGVYEWERILDEFAADYPQYDYLASIEVEVSVWDGVAPITDFDVVLVFTETAGSQFRGVATDAFVTRVIVLTLFAASPRAGQLVPDFPEYNDLEAVTKHEFAHTFGLGHTRTWTTTFGPDIMNSPAPFVYGDGNAVLDGGLHDAKKCISTLDLYGMALLYQWMDGLPHITDGSYSLPGTIPYGWYC